MQSFLDYSQTQTQPMTADQKRQAIANHFAQQIMGQQAQNPMQGMGQMMAGLGMGLRAQDQPQMAQGQVAGAGAQTAAQPSLGQRLGNLFSFGMLGGNS